MSTPNSIHLNIFGNNSGMPGSKKLHCSNTHIVCRALISIHSTILIILFCIPATSFSTPVTLTKNEVKWAVQKGSTLRITGKSNVANFGCDIHGYYQQDTIVYTENVHHNRLVPLKGSLNIDIFKFDCHNKFLTNDLRKTLKAKEYPKLIIRFVALERMPDFESNKDAIKGWIDVEMAGTCVRFEIFYTIEKSGCVIHLNGARTFCFSDFNLTAPKSLGGIIKVKDDFHVDFKLLLNQVI